MSWIAAKQFIKKSWTFIKDQWLFFVAALVGVLGFLFGVRGTKAKEVVDAQRKDEESQRLSRKREQERREQLMGKLGQRLEELKQEEREAVERIIETHSGEFERAVAENRGKPLSDVASDIASKYGLTKI